MSLLGFFEELGQSEVEDLHPAIGRQHDVAGLEIAVRDAAGVSSSQGIRHRNRDLEEAVDLHATLGDDLTEWLALDQLHDQERDSLVFLDGEEGDDIGMIEAGYRLGFPFEPLQSLGVCSHCRG